MSLATIDVDEAVVVEVGRQDAKSAPLTIDDAGLFRHVDESSLIVAEDVVGQGIEGTGAAIDVRAVLPRMGARWRQHGVPGSVVADVEVEVAVAVEIGEGRRGRPVAVAPQTGFLRHILERAVAPVAIESIGIASG